MKEYKGTIFLIGLMIVAGILIVITAIQKPKVTTYSPSPEVTPSSSPITHICTNDPETKCPSEGKE